MRQQKTLKRIHNILIMTNTTPPYKQHKSEEISSDHDSAGHWSWNYNPNPLNRKTYASD